MGKGKTFGGIGVGVILSTIAGVFLAKKKSNIFGTVQKNFGSFSTLIRSLTSRSTEQNKKEVA